jgi:LacI family transcriptional regulator
MVPTMVDVARQAGVSIGTVSNVLRGTAPVADATRERVLSAVAALGYRHNEVARSLRRQATRTLGVVIPDPLNPFYAAIASEVERRARREGYVVLLTDTELDPSTEAAQVAALVERRVDGVVFPGVSERSAIPAELLDRGIPVVVVSFAADDARLGVVDIDEAAAMAAVADHLVGLGHARIAFTALGRREEAVDRRPEALRSAHARHGLELTEAADAPTAICCHDDVTAIALLDRLARQGVRVPEDVSVVGFDDIPLAGHALIALTTVHQDAPTMGTRAVELLLAAIDDRRAVAHRELHPAPLVVRRTSGPARSGAIGAGGNELSSVEEKEEVR